MTGEGCSRGGVRETDTNQIIRVFRFNSNIIGKPLMVLGKELRLIHLYFYFFNLILFFSFIYLFYFTILYGLCHTLTWICHGCTCVPYPEPPSHLPPHPIPLGHPSAPAPSTLHHALNLDWRFVSSVIIYMLQCHSPKSSHPRHFPQSPKDCSIHLCLFCCLTYRVIITIFLNSIYMC